MKWKNIIILVSIIFLTSLTLSDQLSSSNYKTNAIISGTGSSSSPNYNTEVVIDIATGSANSSSYKQTSFLSIPTKATTSTPAPSGSSGSGVIGFAPIPSTPQQSFQINTNFLPIELKVGQTGKQGIQITNNGKANLTVGITVKELQQFIFPEQTSITLNSGDSQMIYFDINAFNNTVPNLYLGEIDFYSGSTNQSVNVALNIVPKEPLFDITTAVINKITQPGKNVSAKVTVINMGDVEKVDVQILSEIKDFNNNTYASKIDTYAITNQTTKDISLILPQNISYGNYIFYSKVIYGNITASSYDTFSVAKSFFENIIPSILSLSSEIKSNLFAYSAPPIIILIITIIFFTSKIIVHIRRKRRVLKSK